MFHFLEQDKDILVQDVRPIRSILAEVKDLLTLNRTLVLALAAFIEGFQPLISKARKRIADRATRQNKKERDRASAKEIK